MKKSVFKKLWELKFTIIFAVTAIVSAFFLVREYTDAKNSRKSFSELSAFMERTVPEEKEKSREEIAREKYRELSEKNGDFIGWIKIDGTNVNYPVMQTVNSPNYYLRRNFEKQYSNYGVPYLDEECSPGVTNNLIIYGHNMKNGTMFTDLALYKNKSFWEEHKTVNFDTLDEFGEYRVMYAFAFDTNNETFCYNDYVDMDKGRFAEFIAECEKRAAYNTGVKAEYGDRLLTLSTCEYTRENGRFVVVAKKLPAKAEE